MKKLRVIFVLLITINVLFAQKKSGKVIYKVISNKNINLKKITKNNESKGLTSFFKNTADFELTFKNDKSIYKRIVKFNKEGEEKKINFFEIIGGGNGVFFSEKGNVIQSKNTFDEYFLIRYSKKKWNVTQEMKRIGGYLCYKAISSGEEKAEVWFSPEIPLNFGPKYYNGLPGLVLEVHIGKIIIRAFEVNFKEVEEIKKPTKGKEITEEDYYKKVKKAGKSLGF